MELLLISYIIHSFTAIYYQLYYSCAFLEVDVQALYMNYMWCIFLILTGQLDILLCYHLSIYSNPFWVIISHRIQYFCICFIGLSWFIFCLNYSSSKFLQRTKVIITMFSISLLYFYYFWLIIIPYVL